MRLKDTGKKMWDIAFRLAMYSCGCGGVCRSCPGCGYYVNPSTSPESEKKSGRNKGNKSR